MKLFRNPFTYDQLIRNLELGLLRAYLLFDIFRRLLMLGIDETHELGKHLGLW